MKKNMGSADRIIRSVIAITLIVLYFTDVISGTLAIVAIVASIIFLATSLVSFCPIYKIFGVKTCKV